MRRRGFRRRFRRVARQYRAWETLACDGTSLVGSGPFITYVIGAGIQTVVPQDTVTGAVGGDPASAINATTLGAQPVMSQVGYTNVFPLWTPYMASMHGGSEVTIKALYGYILPSFIQQINVSSASVGRDLPAKVRIALLQMEFRQEYLVAGQALNNFDVWSHADLSRHRIRWMRDWIMPYDPLNGDLFQYFVGNGAVRVAKTSGNEPLLAGLCGGPRIRMPRLNMKVRLDRPLCLAVGISGNIQGGVDAAGNPGFRVISANASLRVQTTQFIRAFLTR